MAIAVIAAVNVRMAVAATVPVNTSMESVPAVMDIAAIIDHEKGFSTGRLLGIDAGLRRKWAVQAN